VVDARSVGGRVDFQPIGSASGLWVESGLPQSEGNIDPGQLLLTLNLKLDQVALGIHHLLNQLLLLTRLNSALLITRTSFWKNRTLALGVRRNTTAVNVPPCCACVPTFL
jgi:hypothetical protein